MFLTGSHFRQLATNTMVAAVLVAGATLVTAAPALAAGPSWSQDGYGPGNTGYNPDESTLNSSTIDNLEYRWSRLYSNDDSECSYSQKTPVVAGGRAFTSDEHGIHADNAVGGWNLWTFPYQDPEVVVATNLAVVGNVLVATVASCAFGSGTTVYGINAATGEELWWNSMSVNSDTLVVDRGIAVVGGSVDDGDEGPDEVAAFRVSDGSRRWTRYDVDLGAGVSARGRVLLTRTDVTGALAVNITNGAQVWKTTKGWSAQAANPAGDRFYVTDPAGSLVAVKSSSGAAAWTVRRAGGSVSSDGRRVYVARGNVITAYSTKGKKAWSRTQLSYAGRPIRAGGLLYCPVDGEPMAILNPANGATVHPGTAYQYSERHAVVVDGMLFVYDGASLLAYGL